MKMKLPICVLILSLPVAVCVASDDSILLVGKSGNPVRIENGNTIFIGSVSVISKDPAKAMDVTADEIAFRQHGGKNFLKCSGDVTIRCAGRTTTGKDLTIELGDGHDQNVYILNPNGIVIGSTAQVNTGSFFASDANKGGQRVEPLRALIGPSTPNGILVGAMAARKLSDFETWAAKNVPEPVGSFDLRPGTMLPRR